MFKDRFILKRVNSSNLKPLLLFVVLAFALWILIKLSNSYQKTVYMHVTPIDFPKTLRLLVEDSIVLKTTLKMTGYNWLSYASSPIQVEIDFNDVEQVDSLYVWNSNRSFFKVNSQLPPEVHLINIETEQLKFRYAILKQKVVPVKHNVFITFNRGYGIVDSLIVVPNTIKVTGTETFLSKLEFLETNKIELKGVKESFSRKVALNLNNFQEQLTLSAKEVEVKAEVEKFTEGIVEVPIVLLNTPIGKEVKHFPKYVKISYNTTLKNYKTVSISDFKVVCDYNRVDENNSFLIPELTKQPDNVKNVRIHQQKIEFILTE